MPGPVCILTARAHRLWAPLLNRLDVCRRAGGNILLLVPEQFTLAAEQAVMEGLSLKGMFSVDVISPSRLYAHVTDTAGRDEREPLNDAGCMVAFSRAAERLEDRLPYYGSLLRRRGFLEKLNALVRDFKRGGLTPEKVREMSESTENRLLRLKLADLAVLFEEYEKVLGGRFSDGQDKLAYAAGRLEESGYLNGKHMFVYGFDTLTVQLMQLLSGAAKLCESVTAALVCDSASAPDGALYEPIRGDIARFAELLRQQGLSCRTEACPPEPLKHCAAANHLDRVLFTDTLAALPGAGESIRFTEAQSPFDEAAAAAARIRALMADGLPAERIALLFPDNADYSFAVSAALTDAGVPFYTDHPLPALCHGLVRFLLYSLRAAAGGWQAEDMACLLRSGFAPLTFRECCTLSDYAAEFRIRGKLWKEPFTRGPERRIRVAEPLREKLMAPLTRLHSGLKNAKNASESMAAVFGLLQDADACGALKREETRLLKSGFAARVGQNSQIWQSILTLTDQMVRLDPDHPVALRHIADRMECGFSAISLSSLPPARGMLYAGVLGHALQEQAEAVFILGMNDGLLDRETESLLSETERQETQRGTGAFLGLTDQVRVCMARLDLKRAMTLPEKTLYLSWCRTGPDGSARNPLPLVRRLRERVFPDVPLDTASLRPEQMSPVQAYTRLAGLIREYLDAEHTGPDAENEIRETARRCADMRPERLLQAALRGAGGAAPIPPDTAALLYRHDDMSVTRLETFAGCPFRHFVEYGLRPVLSDSWEIRHSDVGNLYHKALQDFTERVRGEPGFPRLAPERTEQIITEVMDSLKLEALSGPLGENDRTLARYRRIRQVLRTAADTFVRQMAAGGFSVYRTEAAFGAGDGGLPPIILRLKDGREFNLQGRIDRVDLLDTGENCYLRVVDYKSSDKSLNADEIRAGRQLQLLMYLEACTKLFERGKPAGAFYFHVQDPMIRTDEDAAEVIEREICKQLQLKGIVLDDPAVIRAMDACESGIVMPKPGTNKSDFNTLTGDQFDTLLRLAHRRAEELTEEMMDGRDDIAPRGRGQSSVCVYCDYAAVCRRPSSDSGEEDAPDSAASGRNLPAWLDEQRDSFTGFEQSAGTDIV